MIYDDPSSRVFEVVSRVRVPVSTSEPVLTTDHYWVLTTAIELKLTQLISTQRKRPSTDTGVQHVNARNY